MTPESIGLRWHSRFSARLAYSCVDSGSDDHSNMYDRKFSKFLPSFLINCSLCHFRIKSLRCRIDFSIVRNITDAKKDHVPNEEFASSDGELHEVSFKRKIIRATRLKKLCK